MTTSNTSDKLLTAQGKQVSLLKARIVYLEWNLGHVVGGGQVRASSVLLQSF